jgi:inosose dehydratase
MAKIPVAGSQITYGQFRKREPEKWTEDKVLAEIRSAGFDGAPAGPNKERTPKQTIEKYAQHGLKPAPGYFSGNYWDRDQRDKILEGAKRQASVARELGLDVLYVATGGFDSWVAPSGKTRSAVAAHSGPEDELPADDFKRMCEVLNEVGRTTQAEGVKACFHNHVGTPLETEAETERMLSMTDPSLIYLGLDTGHLAWAGGDVPAFVKRHAKRIKTMHLKDIYPKVRDQGLREKWNYGQFSAAGVFAELGEGLIDFRSTFDALKAVGFDGWIVSEIDVTTKPTALESLKICRQHLRSIGV